MPLHEVIQGDEEQSAIERIAAAFEARFRQAAEARVGRSGKRGQLLQRIEITIGDDEDHAVLLRELASRLVAIAEDDAEGATRKYAFTLIGKAPPSKTHHAAVLASITLTIGDDNTPPKVADVSATLLRDVGDRHLRLLDSTLTTLERVAPFMAVAEAREEKTSEAQAKVQIHLANLEAEDRKDARDERSSAMMQETILKLSQRHGRLVDALGEYLSARAKKIMDDLKKGEP